ncbi:uncharacterized protein HMPREF1541_09778 [Cyphellophora europaea CBS 101466]|uniref:Glycoside hydrolase family 125 protein n=1 Tax=Cyphellophora europaea (strain CBS 101466) TaxID=1220924 RepID=W2SA68_CYPE1|nr:uncharacterized protein HMPREF1541_09778 [Cyphellophora europaea CBS 101466]ETN44903.1 hypothetical protein HMPREF1541_09778 [Cyphellophora europaea CBS 101466]
MKLLILLTVPACLRLACLAVADSDGAYESSFDSGLDQETLQGLCPDYTRYAVRKHKPFSKGPLRLPSQRPHQNCRKFTSTAVEKVIDDLIPHIKDPDLAKIFENAFPNTLDTTIQWHVDGVESKAPQSPLLRDRDRWQGAQSFVVTGDIDAEWLRDSTNQLSQYQRLAATSPAISKLILGAINTQSEYIIQAPYCNAFQPPSPSRFPPAHNGQEDWVHPAYEPSVVFECKYELDSLANFLSLSNQYHAATGDTSYLSPRWFKALSTITTVIEEQSFSTFNPNTRAYRGSEYLFTRSTRAGTETLNLGGVGNPLANGTNLVRSAFRPSDDACTFGFLIPANAMLSVELSRTATILLAYSKTSEDISRTQSIAIASLSGRLADRARLIREGILEHAVVQHPHFGPVLAYEIDGYGSHLLMDDANVPSLLSLPLLGFLAHDDPLYINTRRLILSPHNPYYLSGPKFSGIGGPHIGLMNAWPMSVLVQALTTDDEDEIIECLEKVKNVSVFGLINESVDVERGVDPHGEGDGMTRSWFAWANSVFAQVVLMLAEKRPGLILDTEVAYVVGKGWQEN